MSSVSERRTPRITAVMREGERVTPLELFFDLVFVFGFAMVQAMLRSIGEVQMPLYIVLGTVLLKYPQTAFHEITHRTAGSRLK